MRLNQVIDQETLTEYIKQIDSENLSKYLILLKTLQNQCTHDIVKLSVYVLEQMESKDILFKFPYFQKSIYSNIQKLNDLQEVTTMPISTEVPSWLNQDIEKKQPNKTTQEEMESIINEFK